MKEKIKIIEVKSEIGAGTRGASLGVEAMKIASLDLNSDFFKQHESIEVENVNELLFDGAKHSYAKFIGGVMIMEERVCLEVYETIFDEFFPIIMAGDHSTAYGTICGIKKAFPKKRLGVIWIDAHADIHTPYTTQSGNMHGMALAMACGIDNLECKVNDPRGETVEYWEQIKDVGLQGPKILPEDIVYIAVRDLEKPENYLVNKYNINFIETEEVNTRPIADADVGAHVELGELGNARQRGHPARADVRHVERDDADPRAPIAYVELEYRRDQAPQSLSVHGPMRKQQIGPGLRHHPGARRHRPRAMCHTFDAAPVEVAPHPCILSLLPG